ncbi:MULTISPECIES: HNH endonuclease signature motif containing protein [unclassified Campylobacter]|uniref:HNH endonuclease n=1 Tax=Campylobacter sp. LR185c TaxID=2014525 RepID=UPI001CC20B25
MSCPFSGIEASRENFLILFRASHIKSYKNSDLKEIYDIHNGLLLSANMDALFDKHLISIDNNRRLKLSYLFGNENGNFADNLYIYNDKKYQIFF